MQVDHYQAARLLTKAYASIAMFVFAAVAFQFFSGETLGIVRSMEDEPQEFWIVLGVQIAVFVAVVTLLYFPHSLGIGNASGWHSPAAGTPSP